MKKETFYKLINEILDQVLDEQMLDENGKKDACYHKVKAAYDVWPSAYASGALVKCRKVGAANWGKSKKKEESLAEADISDDEQEELEDVSKQLKGAVKAHGKQAKTIDKALKKEGIKNCGCGQDPCKTYGIQENKKKSIELEERCQKGYKTHDTQKTKKMFGKTYRNCVKAEETQEIEEKKKKAGTESSKESSLRDWFGRKGAKGKKKGWVDCNAPDGKGGYKSCGRSDGEKRKRYPSCRPTPGACKEKGKGKSWGKKGAKKKNEVLDMRKGFLFEGDDSILEVFKDATLDEGGLVCEACLFEVLQEASCGCPDLVAEAEYRGRKVTLNKPMRGDVKKFKVYVKDPKTGNIKKVNFGDPNMRIKKSNPKRRKSFRARHNCDNPGPKTKARYWSCRKW